MVRHVLFMAKLSIESLKLATFKGADIRTFFHSTFDQALLISFLIHVLLLSWDSLSDRRNVPLEVKNPLQAFLYRQPVVLAPPSPPRREINEKQLIDPQSQDLPTDNKKLMVDERLPLVGNRPLWGFNPPDLSQGQKEYQSQIEQQKLLAIDANASEGRALFRQALMSLLSEVSLKGSCVVNLNHQEVSCEDKDDSKAIEKMLSNLGAPPYSPISGPWIVHIGHQASGSALLTDRY